MSSIGKLIGTFFRAPATPGRNEPEATAPQDTIDSKDSSAPGVSSTQGAAERISLSARAPRGGSRAVPKPVAPAESWKLALDAREECQYDNVVTHMNNYFQAGGQETAAARAVRGEALRETFHFSDALRDLNLAVEGDPDNLSYRVTRGFCEWSLLNRQAGADADFVIARTADPALLSDANALKSLSECDARVVQDRGTDLAIKAINHDAGNELAWLAKGYAQFHTRAFQQSSIALKKAQDLDPSNRLVRLVRALVAFESGSETHEAVTLLKEAINDSRGADPLALALLSRVILRSDEDEAVRLADRAVQNEPQLPWALTSQISALLAQKNYDEAEVAVEKLLSIDAAHPFANLKMAELRLKAERKEEALTHYNRALNSEPRSRLIKLGRCRAYMALEMYSSAIRDLSVLIERNAKDAEALTLMADAKLKSGDELDAEHYAKRAKEADAEAARPYLIIACEDVRTHAYDRAIVGLNRYIGKVDNDRKAYELRGLSYLAIGDYENAEADLRKALLRGTSSSDKVVAAIAAFDVTAVQKRGHASYKQVTDAIAAGDLVAAQGLVDRLIAGNNRDPNAYILRGEIKLQRSLYNSARGDFSRAMKLAPNDARATQGWWNAIGGSPKWWWAGGESIASHIGSDAAAIASYMESPVGTWLAPKLLSLTDRVGITSAESRIKTEAISGILQDPNLMQQVKDQALQELLKKWKADVNTEMNEEGSAGDNGSQGTDAATSDAANQ